MQRSERQWKQYEASAIHEYGVLQERYNEEVEALECDLAESEEARQRDRRRLRRVLAAAKHYKGSLAMEQILHGEDEAERDELRRWLNLSKEGDGIWCARCGNVFHDEDMETNPDDYFTCPLCFTIEHRACRGPIDDEQLHTEQQIAMLVERLAEARVAFDAMNSVPLYFETDVAFAGFHKLDAALRGEGVMAKSSLTDSERRLLEYIRREQSRFPTNGIHTYPRLGNETVLHKACGKLERLGLIRKKHIFWTAVGGAKEGVMSQGLKAEGDHSYDDYLRERARAEIAEQQLAQAREENTRWYKRMERGQKQLAEAQEKIHSLVWNKDGYCRGCGNYGLDNSHFDDCELAPIADGEEGE